MRAGFTQVKPVFYLRFARDLLRGIQKNPVNGARVLRQDESDAAIQFCERKLALIHAADIPTKCKEKYLSPP
ncbi:hypothetical protein [Caballeronia sp. LZ065]|uniref:hypothetical protein n=1 Tax=Caballeronia sp. LZ065 TaxID=3038571 RepID=UPI00286C83F3|nr:hypothetical protein [Caballeronia sp. LZ065]